MKEEKYPLLVGRDYFWQLFDVMTYLLKFGNNFDIDGIFKNGLLNSRRRVQVPNYFNVDDIYKNNNNSSTDNNNDRDDNVIQNNNNNHRNNNNKNNNNNNNNNSNNQNNNNNNDNNSNNNNNNLPIHKSRIGFSERNILILDKINKMNKIWLTSGYEFDSKKDAFIGLKIREIFPCFDNSKCDYCSLLTGYNNNNGNSNNNNNYNNNNQNSASNKNLNSIQDKTCTYCVEGTVKCVLTNGGNSAPLWGIVYDSHTIAKLHIEKEKKRNRPPKKTNFHNIDKNNDYVNIRRKNILNGYETVNIEILQKLINNFHLNLICLNKTNKNNFNIKNLNLKRDGDTKLEIEQDKNEESKRDEKNLLRQLIAKAEQSSKKIENMEINHKIELKNLFDEIKNLNEKHQTNLKEIEEERENSRKSRKKEKVTISEQNIRIAVKDRELSDLKRFSLEVKKENSKKLEIFEHQMMQMKR